MNEVTLYTTPYCPFCIAAVRYLQDNNIKHTNHDVSHDRALREKVSRENGNFPTVPMILVGDIFIGGYDDMMRAAKSGQLKQLIG